MMKRFRKGGVGASAKWSAEHRLGMNFVSNWPSGCSALLNATPKFGNRPRPRPRNPLKNEDEEEDEGDQRIIQTNKMFWAIRLLKGA